MEKVNAPAVNNLLTHIRCILAPCTEVRDVSASREGVGFYLDSDRGEKEYNLVHLSCTPTSPEEGEPAGGWKIIARLANGQFVAEWSAQCESLNADYLSAWFAVMANCSGYTYWLRQPVIEFEEVQ